MSKCYIQNRYYVQNKERGYVGNCILWWKKGGHGYTCNLDEAEIFEQNDSNFQSITKNSRKYMAWEKSYIDERSQKHVDMQNIEKL